MTTDLEPGLVRQCLEAVVAVALRDQRDALAAAARAAAERPGRSGDRRWKVAREIADAIAAYPVPPLPFGTPHPEESA